MSQKKKQREAALFQRLSNVYPVPEGSVEHDDRPDFRIHTTAHGVLGIELTELFQESQLNGRPQQAQESDIDALVGAARDRCIADGVAPAVVSVFLSPALHIPKTHRGSLAVELSRLVASRMPDAADDAYVRVENHWNDPEVPDWIHSVNIARLPGLSKHQWSAPAAGWVQTDCIDTIQSRLDAKAEEYDAYRRHCDACWVLIVADGFRPSSLFRPSPETLEHRYASPFQKVLLMEGFSRSVNELLTTPDPITPPRPR